jgi:predicted permease
MKWWEETRRKLAALWRRDRLDRDLAEEMQSHLEMRAEENRESGMSGEEARYAARRQFGNATALQETSREAWGWGAAERFGQDLRYALRGLRKSAGFTTAAVVTLALGVGATTAVFSVVNAVIFRQLQFPESSRVMTVLGAVSETAKPYQPMEYMYVEWRNRAKSFDIFAGGLTGTGNVRIAGDWREAQFAMVSSEFFRLIGKQPALGRMFSREEDQDGGEPVVLLDNAFWRREFGGDPGVLGRTITLAETAYTIVGVLPPDTRFPGSGRRDLWMPLKARLSLGCGGRGGILAIARLRSGVTRQGAQAEIDALREPINRELASCRARGSAVVMPLRDWLVGEARGTFLMVLGASVLLLLIACANLANLMLARGTGRRREMAIRAAIGAGRWRLAAQRLTESLLLAAIGGALGTALAFAAVRAAPAIRAIEIPRGDEIAVDRGFLLIGIGVTLASGALFGMAPALQVWRRSLSAMLYRGEPPAGRMRGHGFHGALLTAQFALAMVLLTGAGLLANTMLRLLHVDLGLDSSNVFTVQPQRFYQTRARAAEVLRGLAEQVRRMPGVASVSVANNGPLTNDFDPYDLAYEAAGVKRRCETESGGDVDPGYFRTTRIPLLAGREFEPGDALRKPVPLIVNKPAARTLFGTEDPLGKLVRAGDSRVGAMQVIGISGDARLRGVTKEPGPQAYAPLMGGWGWPAVVIVRASTKASALSPAIRAALRSLDPNQPPPKIVTLEEMLSEQVAKPRFYLALLGSFAGLGLILAAVGIYGVTAYAVARRTHEFGVRLALGAEPGDIVRLVLDSGARVIAAGAIAGLAGALVATRLLSSLLFQVKPRDPLTFVATAALLAGIALAACYIPARRATRVDPMEALRHD